MKVKCLRRMDHAENGSMRMLDALEAKGAALEKAVGDRFQLELIERYWDFLEQNNERGGFFSKADSDRILERHVYESLILTDYVAMRCGVSRETFIGDVGSGPGLPGFLFACRKDQPYVALVDSSKRRLGLLEAWVRKVGVPRVEIHFQRAEEVRATWDIVVMRAFVRFPFCIELVTNATRVGGSAVYFGSGRDHFSGREEKYLKQLGFVPRETEHPRELDFLGDRRIFYFEKVSDPDVGYPRKWVRIQSEMEQWER